MKWKIIIKLNNLKAEKSLKLQARVVIKKPKIIFADEPTINSDAKTFITIFDKTNEKKVLNENYEFYRYIHIINFTNLNIVRNR